MLVPSETLVLVADGRKRLLFKNSGDATFPQLEVVTHDERNDRSTEEIGTDEPGSTFAASGTAPRGGGPAGAANRSSYEQPDYHQQEEDRFAAETAEMLKTRALRNEFSKLIVVAPPRTLGELRKHYHKEVEARLLGEIAKDVTHRPTDEIEKLLADTEVKGNA